MNAATLWWDFWQLSFAIAGGSFAIIAAVVAVRGFADLRSLIRLLEHEKGPDSLPKCR
ncbi:MAG TPA: hypothetical protein VLX58_14700 [Bryobacteraceae bacterium]|nr:hypothetical protein [Bryobacteraceae bacterium]